jgi:hypothetical protein
VCVPGRDRRGVLLTHKEKAKMQIQLHITRVDQNLPITDIQIGGITVQHYGSSSIVIDIEGHHAGEAVTGSLRLSTKELLHVVRDQGVKELLDAIAYGDFLEWKEAARLEAEPEDGLGWLF